MDSGAIAIRPAVELSYLKLSEQEEVEEFLSDYDYGVDMKKAEKLKEYSQLDKINQDSVHLIISGKFAEKKAKKITSVKLSVKQLKDYVPKSVALDGYEDYILSALEYYKENRDESLAITSREENNDVT